MAQFQVNGTSLAQWRAERGFSQRSLARMLNISSGYLCDVEAEKKVPSPAMAKRIADALEIPVGVFYRVAEVANAS